MYEKGEFDYEKDGFGKVTYDLDNLINVVAEYMKTNCVLHESYKSRIEEAFLDRETTHKRGVLWLR